MTRPRCQRGAALLTAMIIVTLVATLAAGMVWQQWHSIEVEAAERERSQSHWILSGALDWARLILREDARDASRNNNPDHLGEPWAVPLAEARLSTFLATDKDNTDDAPDAFLSGLITDAQARYNLFNLVEAGKIRTDDLEILQRLCATVDVPQVVATQIAEAFQQASGQSSGSSATVDNTIDPAVMPVAEDDLSWLGIDPEVMGKLRPYVTLLPQRTKVNVNTAPKEVIAAAIKGSDMSRAERLVRTRERTPMKSAAQAFSVLDLPLPNDPTVSVTTDFFEVYGALRLENRLFEERSLVQRSNLQVNVIRRERVRDPHYKMLLQYHSNKGP